jgi:excisionase family DNA binding protein
VAKEVKELKSIESKSSDLPALTGSEVKDRMLSQQDKIFQTLERIAVTLEKIIDRQSAEPAKVGFPERRFGSRDRRSGLMDRRHNAVAANGAMPSLPQFNEVKGILEESLQSLNGANGAHAANGASTALPSTARFMTASEVAHLLNTSKGTVYLWVNHKKIPYVKINGSVRFREDEIHRWLSDGNVYEKRGE